MNVGCACHGYPIRRVEVRVKAYSHGEALFALGLVVLDGGLDGVFSEQRAVHCIVSMSPSRS